MLGYGFTFLILSKQLNLSFLHSGIGISSAYSFTDSQSSMGSQSFTTLISLSLSGSSLLERGLEAQEVETGSEQLKTK